MRTTLLTLSLIALVACGDKKPPEAAAASPEAAPAEAAPAETPPAETPAAEAAPAEAAPEAPAEGGQ
jgi:hypothetical protein